MCKSFLKKILEIVINSKTESKHMPANGKVSVRWQIVFAIISPINLWAFYRIKKLRLYALYVLVPSAIISSIVITGMLYEMNNSENGFDINGNRYPEPTVPPHMTPIEPKVWKYNTSTYTVFNMVTSVVLTVFSVYLAVKWSRQWNEQFA